MPVVEGPGVFQLADRVIDDPVLVDRIHAQCLAVHRRMDRQTAKAGMRGLPYERQREPEQTGGHRHQVSGNSSPKLGCLTDNGGIGGISGLQHDGAATVLHGQTPAVHLIQGVAATALIECED